MVTRSMGSMCGGQNGELVTVAQSVVETPVRFCSIADGNSNRVRFCAGVEQKPIPSDEL